MRKRYTVAYIEEGHVRTDPEPHEISGIPCTISQHNWRVSSRLFTNLSDAQAYADTMSPSRKAFVIGSFSLVDIPKEHT